MTILVTNDDSVTSSGIHSLAKVASRIERVRIVAPSHPMSGISKAMTFNRIMRAKDRIFETEGRKIPETAISGSPADCVLFAQTNFDDEYSLVVSGINPGDNTSLHSILTSGTIGACFEAALLGMPSISFSVQSSPKNWFDHTGFAPSPDIEELVEKVIRKVHGRKFPEGADVLAVNIPTDYIGGAPLLARRPQRLRVKNDVIWNKDPLGNPFFWLSGSLPCELENGSDCWELLENRNAVITPLSVGLCTKNSLSAFEKWLE